MTFEKHLARKGRPEIPIALGDVRDRQLPNMRPQQSVGGPAASSVPQAGSTMIRKL